MKLYVKETVLVTLLYLCPGDSQVTIVLVTELAQQQWEGSFRKPVGQYGMSLTRKDSLKHQPPRKNG